MSQCVDFKGTTITLTPPSGMDEMQVRTIRAYRNDLYFVTCWEFTDEEITEIIRTRRVYLSVMSQASMPPVYIGSEGDTRDLISDHGAWAR